MKSENQNSIFFNGEAGDEVATALSNLKRVEAPGDFDFRLKARIARSTPQQVRRTGMLLAAKFALPVVVLLGFGAFLITSSGDTAVVSDIPPVTEPQTRSMPADATQPPTANDGAVASATNPVSPAGNIQINRNSNSQALQGSSVDQPMLGGSVDEAVRSESPILPRGFDSNTKIDPKSIQSNSQLSVNDLLVVLGLTGEFAGSGYLVRSVSANSVAARAGVRSGDVIEAINERPIDAQTIFRGAFSGKSIRILRDGRSMNLNLGS